MGKKWLRRALALVMIVAGLAGFLWEFTVVDNDMYTIVDTHYGNRIVCHITSTDGNSKDGVGGENADEAVRKALAGDVEAWRAFFAFRYGERCVPGIEWLTEPVLPWGSKVVNNNDAVRWYADECVFYFSGEFDGFVRSCDQDSFDYRSWLEAYQYYSVRSYEEVQVYTIGNMKVMRKAGKVHFAGVCDGICYVGSVDLPEGKTITDWQIMQFGMRYALPRSWEVTLLVLVNVLRGLCLATAVAGVVILAVPARKRKRKAPAAPVLKRKREAPAADPVPVKEDSHKGKKWLRRVLALVMIIAGLTGFLWEFTVEENNFYTIVDTHYGNRIVCHKPYSGDLIAAVDGENMDDVVRKMVMGGVEAWQGVMGGVLYGKGGRCVPGIEWLTEPILPKGYTVEDYSYWFGDTCGFRFRNELDGGRFAGEIRSCSPNGETYQSFLKSFLSNDDDRTRYAIGSLFIIRGSKDISFMGVRNGICYIGTVNIPKGKTLTDWQIMQFGMRYALPQSWEVTLLVLVNVLRGLCLATAVAGVGMLVVPVLKRKKRTPASDLAP